MHVTLTQIWYIFLLCYCLSLSMFVWLLVSYRQNILHVATKLWVLCRLFGKSGCIHFGSISQSDPIWFIRKTDVKFHEEDCATQKVGIRKSVHPAETFLLVLFLGIVVLILFRKF